MLQDQAVSVCRWLLQERIKRGVFRDRFVGYYQGLIVSVGMNFPDFTFMQESAGNLAIAAGVFAVESDVGRVL
jgi:hypothetical protein